MTADALREAAQEIFGRRGWITDLAACLRVDRTTVSRYVNGQIPVPGPVAAAVTCWLRAFRETGRRPEAL